MEFTKSDLLKLLTVMEGELQAREVAIAVLKAEQTKQLLYPSGPKDGQRVARLLKSSSSPAPSKASAGTATMIPNRKTPLSVKGMSNISSPFSVTGSDPMAALLRDGSLAFDPNFEDSTSRALLGIQLKQLTQMTEKQKSIRNYLKGQLEEINTKYNNVFSELEREKSRAEYFDRESCLKQVDTLESEKEFLKTNLESLTKQIESEKEREKKMILCLLTERKQLIVKLIEEKQRNNELVQVITNNKSKISEMIEGLEEESKRSLLMELDLEKLQSDFKKEKQVFIDKIHLSESRNNQMVQEIDRLRKELESIKPGSSSAIPSSNMYRNLEVGMGEGVRSSIVTVNASSGVHRIVPNVSSVMPVNSPKANIAHTPLSSTKIPPTIPPPPILTATSLSSAPSSNSNQSLGSNTSSKATTYNFNTIKASPKMVLANTTYPTSPNAVVDSKSVATMSHSGSDSDDIPPQLPSSQPPSKLPESVGVPLYQPQLRSVHESLLTSSKSVDIVTGPVSVTKAPLIKRLSSSGSPRGTPPPVPPNKPVLPAQILKERSKLIQATASSSTSSNATTSSIVEGEKFITGKLVSSSSSSSSFVESKSKTIDLIKRSNNNEEDVMVEHNGINNGTTVDQSNVDLICQELADFQKLLVSMVNNKTSTS